MHKLNKSKKHRVSSAYLGLGLIAAPAVVSGAILSSSYAFAGSSSIDTVRLDLPLSCGVITSGTNSHTATVANGVYTPDIGTTTMNIVCNDNGGFSVYATGFTNNLIGETISNKLVGTALSGNATIETGTATGPGSTDVSNWAMKLATDSGDDYPITILDDYDDYHTVPSNHTKVATRLSGTDAGEDATGSTLTSTYAAYISATQYADTYNGKVKYTLVYPHNAPAPVALYLQDTAGVVAAVPNVGDTAIAMDQRDGLEYMVGRLADGNVWLLDNLALDLTAPDASTMVTASNTNASAESLNALFNGVSCDEYSGGGEDHNLACAAVSSTFDISYTKPYIDTNYVGRSVSDVTTTSKVGGDWLIGAYYNYCAASAGSYCNSDYDYTPSGDSTEDICPRGWRMPTGNYSGEYYSLYESYGSDGLAFTAALRTPLSGRYYDTIEHMGENGGFWSSSMDSSSSMNILSTDNEYPYISYDQRDSGYSVRCLIDH